MLLHKYENTKGKRIGYKITNITQQKQSSKKVLFYRGVLQKCSKFAGVHSLESLLSIKLLHAEV